MKLMSKLLPAVLATAFVPAMFAATPVMAAKDAGHGHDYRTFHTN